MHDVDLSRNEIAKERIGQEVDRIILELDSVNNHRIYIPYIFTDGAGSKSIDISLTTDDIEKLMVKIFFDFNVFIEEIYQKHSNVSAIIISGNLVRMQSAKVSLTNKFTSNIIFRNNESVAGIAYLAGIASRIVKDIIVIDVIPNAISIENNRNISHLVPQWSSVPITGNHIFSVASENQMAVGVNIIEISNGNITTLGILKLDFLHPLDKRNSQIRITIDISADLKIEAEIELLESNYKSKIYIE